MATQAYAHVRTFTQAHSIVFLSDNLRNTLREVIRENGISPSKMMRDIDSGRSKLVTAGLLRMNKLEIGGLRQAYNGGAS